MSGVGRVGTSLLKSCQTWAPIPPSECGARNLVQEEMETQFSWEIAFSTPLTAAGCVGLICKPASLRHVESSERGRAKGQAAHTDKLSPFVLFPVLPSVLSFILPSRPPFSFFLSRCYGVSHVPQNVSMEALSLSPSKWYLIP